MKAIIFDLFETLVTEWDSHKYTKRMIAGDLGADYEKFSCIMESLHEKMYIGSCTFEKAIELSSKLSGVIPTDEQLSAIIRKLTDTKAECFACKHPEIIDMLESLKNSGYRFGLVSNCAADEVTAFGNSGIYGYFDTVILSYEVGLCKPDVKIYKLCAEKLGVKPEDCLFIGDGGSNELWGARDAGMTPLRAMWFVNKYEKNIKEMPFDKADTPDDVVGYIKLRG